MSEEDTVSSLEPDVETLKLIRDIIRYSRKSIRHNEIAFQGLKSIVNDFKALPDENDPDGKPDFKRYRSYQLINDLAKTYNLCIKIPELKELVSYLAKSKLNQKKKKFQNKNDLYYYLEIHYDEFSFDIEKYFIEKGKAQNKKPNDDVSNK